MVDKRRVISLLPAVNQTDTLTKFFSATVDHMFQPESVEFLGGYIGSKPVYYDATKDFYVGEPTKSRQDYQLPVTAVSKNQSSGIPTNIMFYHDYVNSLQFQGALTTNQTRLFEQEYYSWSPPIDLDKLINFTDYYWVPFGPAPILLLNPTDLRADAVGQPHYTYNGAYQLTATGETKVGALTFSTGLIITPTADTTAAINGTSFIINNVGRSIQLLNNNGYIDPNWDDRGWDVTGWDGNAAVYVKDYLTLGRAPNPSNQWSLANRWFHIAVLTVSGTLATTVFQSRAARPIIEFDYDLQLYNSGFKGRASVSNILDNVPDVFGTIVGQTSYVINGRQLTDGDTILVVGDSHADVNNRVYQVGGLNTLGVITLALVGGAPLLGDAILVRYGTLSVQNISYTTAVQYWYNGMAWIMAQQKNQYAAPLFQLYDLYGNALNDPSVYPNSTFVGNSVFTYAVDVHAAIDSELGIQPLRDQFGNYVYNNTLVTDTSTYVSNGTVTAIVGYQYYRNNTLPVPQYNNAWYRSPVPSRQYIVNDFTISLPTASFTIDQVPEANPGLLPSIYVNLMANGLTTQLVQGTDYTVSGNTVTLAVPAVAGQRVLIRSWNNRDTPINTVGFYELPPNLTANANNQQVQTVTQSQFLQHFTSIIENQPDFSGSPLGVNDWRDTAQIRGLGLYILQHKAPLIKPMILSSGNITVGVSTVLNHTEPMQVMQYAQNQYVRFYNRFIQSLFQLSANGYTLNQTPDVWVSTALRQINLGKSPNSPWANSGPDGPQAGYTYLRSTAPTYVPPTGTRLGVSKAYQPTVSQEPQTVGYNLVIQCHDGARFVMAKDGLPLGSINYGLASTSDPLLLSNPVAAAWLQFELDLFNNMPDAYSNPQAQLALDIVAYLPGKWRRGHYTQSEYLQVTYPMFDRWVTTYQVDYRANTTYNINDPFTWNYNNIQDRDGQAVPGYWQGMYRWFYDTDRPHLAPWEMLGFSQQPPWWTTEYGPAPYTSGNTYMWSDLAAGIIRQGPRAGVYLPGVRPGLLSCIPVDAQGNLLPPVTAGCVIAAPGIDQAKAAWVFGDGSPVETVWIYSNEYTFVTAQYSYLMKPAQFIEYNWDTLRTETVFADQPTAQTIYIDTDNRRPNSQLYVHREDPSAINGNLSIPNESTLSYYGSGGIQHWISEYLVSQSLNVTQYLGSIVRGTAAQLAHQCGGFVTANLYLTADSFGQVGYTSQIIPSENVKTYLYKSASIRESFYGGVIVTQVAAGWRITGYDVVDQYFVVIPSNQFGSKTTVVVGHDTVSWYKTGVKAAQQVSYGQIFATKQLVFDFLVSLQRYQEFQGFVFDQYNADGNTTYDWVQSGREFLLWSQGNWANGNFIALSPLATMVKYVQPFGNVQFVNALVSGTFPVVDKLGSRIDGQNLDVLRYDDTITITPTGTQTIFGMRLFANTLESVILIDNVTSFEDTVYDPLYDLAQPRLRLFAYRTNDWDGRVDAPGFFLYQNGTDNQWNLVTNFEKTANDFTKYYNIDQPKNYSTIDPITGNLVVNTTSLAAVDDATISALSKHQIGYQHRPYLANLLLEESTEFQFYQGFIRQKGTVKSFDALLRNQTIVPSTSTYVYYEEYALRTSRYGSTALNINIDFIIPQHQYLNDPQQIQVFGLQSTDRELDSVITLIPNDPLIVVPPISYSSVTNPLFPLNTTTEPNYATDLPTAGYPLIGETTFTVANATVLSSFWETQNAANASIVNGDTVWQFIDEVRGWNTWKFSTANVNIVNTTPSIGSGNPTVINCNGNVGLSTGDLIVLDGIANVSALQGSFYVGNIVGHGRSFEVGVNTFTVGTGGNVSAYKTTRFATTLQRDTSPPLNGWQTGDISYVDHSNYGINGWTVYQYLNHAWMPIRTQTYDVNVDGMQQAKLYSLSRGQVYTYLDYYDPAKGAIPGQARKNLDRISYFDPANYNTGNTAVYALDPMRAWGVEHVGETWWDISAVRYYDYEIGTNSYRWQNWGKIAPGTRVNIYEWVESPVNPSQWSIYVANQSSFSQYGLDYVPTGTVYNVNDPPYTQNTTYNAANTPQTRYYFWVSNATTLPLPPGRRVTTLQISNFLTNPSAYALPWYAAIDSRTILVSGIGRYLSNQDTVLSLQYTHQANNQIDYKQYDLVREHDPDSIPENFFWLKLKDSLTGKDGQDENVPDPYLSTVMRYGTLIRPRQSWFQYRVLAAQTYVSSANTLLNTILLVPDINRGSWVNYFYIAEPPPQSDYTVGSLSSMYALGGTIPNGSTIVVLAGPDTQNLWTQYQYSFNNGQYLWTELAVQAYNTPNYWTYVDWYLLGSGVTSTTVVNFTVATDADRQPYQGISGVLIKVLNRGDGYWAIYQWQGDSVLGTWITVGYQNGTVQISTGVYDGSVNTMLFGTTPFDSTGFDIFPHAEFGNIIDGLRYAIFNNPNPAVPGESVYLNKLFFAMINYVLVEQGFVDWIFKTSFIYLRGFNIPLTTSLLYQPDYGDALLSYLNEVKPYHAKVRTFINQYTWTDSSQISTTDFDNPANVSVSTNIAYSNAAWQQNYLSHPQLIRTLKIRLLFDRVASGQIGTAQPQQGAFYRIQQYYAPTAGMIPVDDPALIPGADYRGIIMQSLGFAFAPGWSLAPWNSPTGWDAGAAAFSAYYDIFVQGGQVPQYDQYYGTGSRKAYTLSRVPQNPAHVVVWSDGVLRQYGVDWLIPNSVSALQLVSAGTGYQVGDQLYLDLLPRVAPTDLTVTAVDSQGGITAWTVNTTGTYDIFTAQSIPAAYQAYAVGTGIGASFNAVWAANTLIFFTAPSSSATPNVFVLYVGTTFLPAPTGPIDIINDGSGFSQPYVESGHPEELYQLILPESVRLDTYQSAIGGAPVIYMRIWQLDGRRDHFPLGIAPMDQSAVIAQIDGRMLTYGLNNDYVINYSTNSLVFLIPPNGSRLQIITIGPGGSGTSITNPQVVSGGRGYLPGDRVTLAGGNTLASNPAILQVTAVQAANATITSGGMGYLPGDVLILKPDSTTSMTRALELTVSTVNALTGTITAVSIAQSGIYNYLPQTTRWLTNGAGSGAAINISWAVQSVITSSPGNYSVRPSQPVAQQSSSGAGLGATFAVLWSAVKSTNVYATDGTETVFTVDVPPQNNATSLLFITNNGQVLNGTNHRITANGRLITISPAPLAGTVSITVLSTSKYSIVNDQELLLQIGVYAYTLSEPPTSTLPPYLSTTVSTGGKLLPGPQMDVYSASGYTNVFAAAYMPSDPSYLLVYVQDYQLTYNVDYQISGNNVLLNTVPAQGLLVSLVCIDPFFGYNYLITNGLIIFLINPPTAWNLGAWDNYFGWDAVYPVTAPSTVKVLTYSEDVSYKFVTQTAVGPAYPAIPDNAAGTYVLIAPPYDDSTLMVWVNGVMQTLLYDYALVTIGGFSAWDVTGWQLYPWELEFAGSKAVSFSSGPALTKGPVVTMQYMAALPDEPAIAWRTIMANGQTVSTVISDANKTLLISTVYDHSTTIEVADITVLPVPSDTVPGTIWIDDERIDYWQMQSVPTNDLPHRGVLSQLLRGSLVTPVGNVSTGYDTIFYDGDGATTLFATGSGTRPPGGNIAVFIGEQIQVDTATDQNVGTYTVVINPSVSQPGTYVSFVTPPPVGWRNVRLASPRYEATNVSSISHLPGSTVIAAGVTETIPGGYGWVASSQGLQYNSTSSLAKFLLAHPGTRT